jgi:hypothetical protein
MLLISNRIYSQVTNNSTTKVIQKLIQSDCKVFFAIKVSEIITMQGDEDL